MRIKKERDVAICIKSYYEGLGGYVRRIESPITVGLEDLQVIIEGKFIGIEVKLVKNKNRKLVFRRGQIQNCKKLVERGIKYYIGVGYTEEQEVWLLECQPDQKEYYYEHNYIKKERIYG